MTEIDDTPADEAVPGALSAEVEEHLAGLSHESWQALVMRVRPPAEPVIDPKQRALDALRAFTGQSVVGPRLDAESRRANQRDDLRSGASAPANQVDRRSAAAHALRNMSR